MFRFEFNKKELEEISKKALLTDLQERLIEYRIKEYSIDKMAMLERMATATISRELRKAKNKIKKSL